MTLQLMPSYFVSGRDSHCDLFSQQHVTKLLLLLCHYMQLKCSCSNRHCRGCWEFEPYDILLSMQHHQFADDGLE